MGLAVPPTPPASAQTRRAAAVVGGAPGAPSELDPQAAEPETNHQVANGFEALEILSLINHLILKMDQARNQSTQQQWSTDDKNRY